MLTQDDIKYAFKNALGMGGHFGSKSGYREKYPDRKPVFNAYVTAEKLDSDTGLKTRTKDIWWGDLELTDMNTLTKLFILSRELDIEIFIYRESTVLNQTMNGREFPYNDHCFAIRTFQNGDMYTPVIEDKY